MENSGGISASLQGRYASALYDLASENKAVAAVEQDLGALAQALCRAGVPAIFSYAGATRAPLAQPLPTRCGGFGGVQGLVDFLRAQAITQVPLPDRVHRNRPLSELGPMAEVVAATVFDRAGVTTELSITQRPSLRSLGYG